MRKFITYPIGNIESFKIKLLLWANQFDNVAYLDSNNYPETLHQIYSNQNYECLVGIDKINEISFNCSDKNNLSIANGQPLNLLKKFYTKTNDYIFGFFAYDLKNKIENLTSANPNYIKMPDMHLFQPRYIFIISKYDKTVRIGYNYLFGDREDEIRKLFNKINNLPSIPFGKVNEIAINTRITREQYLSNIQQIKKHIQRGDIYEINFCQEFYSENVKINPLQVYLKLKHISPSPYSCYYRLNDKYLLSVSPERFLKKIGNTIISQPMKGTIRRGKNKTEDNQLKSQLLSDIKELSENVMIVDVVRNDLSRCAKKGTAMVDELYGIYTFPQVHQLISTISCELREDIHFIDVIKNVFPMASMTGAPKIRAMELIEEYETIKRGIFSGSAGYISPDENFDFNVVIRSILYNSSEKYLSFLTGSAITHKSDAQREYEECLLKAKPLIEALK